jgi:8-oxo-dGTP pyrophosphatase MutT (NUDIX family)
MENPWMTTSTEVKYQNPWITVEEHQVVRPDGKPGIYGVVRMRPTVAVIALNDRNDVLFVESWNYPRGYASWEIVTGFSETGETLLAAAQRELREEAGILADHWEPLIEMHESSGATDDLKTIFLAQGLREGEPHWDGTERINLQWVPLAACRKLMESGQMKDAPSVAGILHLLLLHSPS